jgi:hypothetical protein
MKRLHTTTTTTPPAMHTLGSDELARATGATWVDGVITAVTGGVYIIPRNEDRTTTTSREGGRESAESRH